MTSFLKYDVVVVKFPFASSLKYKARPAVIVSSTAYNNNIRDTLLILAISSKMDTKLDFEKELNDWKDAGLLKQSIFKSSVATIEKEYVLAKLGTLSKIDRDELDNMIKTIC